MIHHRAPACHSTVLLCRLRTEYTEATIVLAVLGGKTRCECGQKTRWHGRAGQDEAWGMRTDRRRPK